MLEFVYRIVSFVKSYLRLIARKQGREDMPSVLCEEKGERPCLKGTCQSESDYNGRGVLDTEREEHYDFRRVKTRMKRTVILYIFFGTHTANVVQLADRIEQRARLAAVLH